MFHVEQLQKLCCTISESETSQGGTHIQRIKLHIEGIYTYRIHPYHLDMPPLSHI